MSLSCWGVGREEEVQWSIVIYLNYCLFFLNQFWQVLHFIISIILSALFGLVLSLHINKLIDISLNHISCYQCWRTNPGLGGPSTPTCHVLTKGHKWCLCPWAWNTPKGRYLFLWVPGPARRPYLQIINMILTVLKHAAIGKKIVTKKKKKRQE